MTFSEAIKLSPEQTLEIKQQAMQKDEESARALVYHAVARRIHALKTSYKNKLKLYNSLAEKMIIKVEFVGR